LSEVVGVSFFTAQISHDESSRERPELWNVKEASQSDAVGLD